MSGLVGVIAQETARYSMFSSSLTGTRLPAGAEVRWQFGHNIAANANALVHEMYQREKDWLWLLGDDHSWSPDLLEKLLAHDVAIVAPVCLMRNPPYRPVAFTARGERLDLERHQGGLVKVWACGSGGMLFRREVFDAVPEPWFEAGVNSPVQLGEDILFCRKAADAGYPTHVDLDASLGHCTTAVVWAVREPDGWTYGFSMMGGFEVTMPPKASWAYADTKGAGK